MPKFRIRKRYIDGLVNWLQELRLAGDESRTRTWFATLLKKELDTLEDARIALLSEYADKDSDGNPKIAIDKSGKKVYDVPKEKLKELNDNYNKILEIFFTFEPSRDIGKMLVKAEKLVCESPYLFGPREGMSKEERTRQIGLEEDYFVWCKAFGI